MSQRLGEAFVEITGKDHRLRQSLEEAKEKVESATARMQTALGSVGKHFSNFGGRMRHAGEGAVDFGENVGQGLTLPLMLLGGGLILASQETKKGQREFEKLKENLKQVAVAIAPLGTYLLKLANEYMPKLVNMAKSVSQWWEKLSPGTKKLIVVIGLLLAVIGPVVMTIGALTMVLGGLSSALGVIFSPVGAIIGVLVALGGVFVYLWKKSDVFRGAMLNLWEKIKSAAGVAVDWIREKWNQFTAWWDQMWPMMELKAMALWNYLKPKVQEVVNFILTAWQRVSAWWHEVWPQLKQTAQQLWDYLVPIVEEVVTLYITQWKRVADWWIETWPILKQKAQELWEYLQPAVEEVTSFFLSQWETVSNWWQETWPQLKEAFENIWNGILTFIEWIMPVLLVLLTFVWPVVKSVIVSVWNIIKAVIQFTLQYILAGVDAFAALFTGNWKGLWDAVKRMFKAAWDLIVSLLKETVLGKAWSVIKDFATKVQSKIKGLWDKAVSMTQDTWNKITSTISGFVEKIKRKIGEMLGSWKGAIDSFGIGNVTIGNVRKAFGLAKGGLVTGPTFAMVGEGRHDEAVLPLSSGVFSKLGQGIAQHLDGSVGNGELVVNVMLDGRQIVSSVRKELKRDLTVSLGGVR